MMLDFFLTLLVTYEFVLSEIVASPTFVIVFYLCTSVKDIVFSLRIFPFYIRTV